MGNLATEYLTSMKFISINLGPIGTLFRNCPYSYDSHLALQVPTSLLVTFAVCTVLLIAVHMLALMISTCILPNVEAVANLHFQVFLVIIILYMVTKTAKAPTNLHISIIELQTQKTVFESPHTKMNFIVELAWGFSTVIGKFCYLKFNFGRSTGNFIIRLTYWYAVNFSVGIHFISGILLFLVEIAILCWVKFFHMNHVVAWTATGLLIPILIIFIAFAAHFYLKLVAHKSEVRKNDTY